MTMTLLSRKIVTTRKPHGCYGCEGAIPVGSNAELFCTAGDGEGVWSTYFCENCTLHRGEAEEGCEDVEDLSIGYVKEYLDDKRYSEEFSRLYHSQTSVPPDIQEITNREFNNLL